MKPVRSVLALFLVVLVAAPAAATHGGIHPTFRDERVYFQCNGATRLYQANWLAAGGDESSYVPWTTVEPRGTVLEEGHGCGGLDWGGITDETFDPVFQDTFTGNLRDMTVRMYNFAASYTRTTPTDTLRVYAEIDGVPLFPPGGRTVTVTPQPMNGPTGDEYDFTITNIGYADEIRDASGNVVDVETGGAASEDGNGEIVHTITLMVGRHGTALGQDPTGHNAAFWAWYTHDVKPGIFFNPEVLAEATVEADLPSFD
jgi:hypothetical protein